MRPQCIYVNAIQSARVSRLRQKSDDDRWMEVAGAMKIEMDL